MQVLKKFDTLVSIECCLNVITLPCEIQKSTISPSVAFITASDQGYYTIKLGLYFPDGNSCT